MPLTEKAFAKIEELEQQCRRFESHLKSEQRITVMHGEELVKHETVLDRHSRLLLGDPEELEKYPGIAYEMAELRKSSRRNGKFLMAISGGMAPFLVEKLIQLAHHIK